MRGPWDIRFFVMQQALVLLGALGLVLMSCGPLRQSPYKSSLFANRVALTSRTVVCRVYIAPTVGDFADSYPSILPAKARAEFSTRGTVTFELADVPSKFSECVIQIDPTETSLDSCVPLDFRSESLSLEVTSIGNQHTLTLREDAEPKATATPCPLRAATDVKAVPETERSVRLDARAAAQKQWP